MNPAKIVIHKVECDIVLQVFELFAATSAPASRCNAADTGSTHLII